MNILSMTAHSIEEYDIVRMFTDLGHDVFSPGAYIDPSHPADDMRPALPDAPYHADLAAIVNALPHGDNGPTWTAKDDLPPELIEWADTIMVHHVTERWLFPQWPRIRHKRVIWRTVGQSDHVKEHQTRPYRDDGLEIVRYSPNERVIPNFAGEDAMIRFYKDPDEYQGWTGEGTYVLVITQNPIKRQQYVGTAWAIEATKGLPTVWVGPQTETVQPLLDEGQRAAGKVSPYDLMSYMRNARVVLYTGTIPASYTLGLIEAMMTGTPVVAIGPQYWSAPTRSFRPYAAKMYEGHAIAPLFAEEPKEANTMLTELLEDYSYARNVGDVSRERAIALFGKDKVYRDWQGWLDEKRQPEPEPDELPDVAGAA